LPSISEKKSKKQLRNRRILDTKDHKIKKKLKKTRQKEPFAAI
jgi:hypothetical protein